MHRATAQSRAMLNALQIGSMRPIGGALPDTLKACKEISRPRSQLTELNLVHLTIVHTNRFVHECVEHHELFSQPESAWQVYPLVVLVRHNAFDFLSGLSRVGRVALKAMKGKCLIRTGSPSADTCSMNSTTAFSTDGVRKCWLRLSTSTTVCCTRPS